MFFPASRLACSFKNPTTIILFAVFPFLFSSVSISGEYHATSEERPPGLGETLSCSQCHTMHGRQGNASLIYGGAIATYPKLLRASSILNLCLYCHGETTPSMSPTPPKVVNNTLSSTTSSVPSAGDFKHSGYVVNHNRHDIDETGAGILAATPPGYNRLANGTDCSLTSTLWTGVVNRHGNNSQTSTGVFTCIFCHDQHGNKNYRNLRYDPGCIDRDTDTTGIGRVRVEYSMSGSTACSDGSATPCKVAQTVAAGGGLNKYQRGNVTFREAPVDADTDPQRGISAWCGKCHTNFYGKSGDSTVGAVSGVDPGAGHSSGGNPWVRHPVQDINVGAANYHTDTTNWGSASASIRHVDPDGTAGNSDDQPLCLSCHYAHGGGNPNYVADYTLDHSMLVMLDSSNNINLESDYGTSTGRMRNTCQACHNQ